MGNPDWCIGYRCGERNAGFASWNYDWVGIVIFFLPIVLSAYAFRLYVRQMQSHLDNLEQIVLNAQKSWPNAEEVAESEPPKGCFSGRFEP
ncbi:MAG: hypothetical protein H6641_22660 [Caldilineaceae bacterium]|nr:hypothetical protein [Caldilineaceae bacterium]